MIQKRNARRESLYSWTIAGVFSLVILAVSLLAFLRPIQQDVAELQPVSNDEVRAILEGIPEQSMNCDTLIDHALLVSDEGCQRIGRNEVCYGNKTIDADLASTFTGEFSFAGDIVPVDMLQRMAASPLNLNTEEWGIAVFKLAATLPRTVPGQNVTFLIFGNTTLDNASGDLQAFYFSSGLGDIICDEVPFDGIVVSMPDGTGLSFQANGSDLTVMGTAIMEAQSGDQMAVSLLGGSGQITSDGQTQFFGAGSAVNVPLSGANGLTSSGPPSEPVPLSAAALSASCALSGIGCNPGEIVAISPEEAQALIEAALAAGSTLVGTGTTTETTTTTTTGTGDGDGGDGETSTGGTIPPDSDGGTGGGIGSGGCDAPPCGEAEGHNDGGGGDGGSGGGKGGGNN
jgi:hypothetical protein